MAQDLRERAMQLREWLQEILPGENSDFEVTQETVEALERFRESRTKAVEKQIVEIHHLESKTVKAKEKTKKIESQYPILQEMKKRLSEESREKLNQLGKVAAKMGVDEFSSETSFLAAANRHLIKQVDISADARKIEKEVKKLIDLNAVIESKLGELKCMADIRESERDSAQLKMSEELQSIKFFQRKVEEYKDRIRYLKEELSDVGYSEELCHQKLVDRSKEIDSLAKSVEKLDLHLESFKGFPTDYNLAKVKLAEEKQILAEWQKKLMETVTKPSD